MAITLGQDDSDVCLYDNGKEIGRFQFDEIENELGCCFSEYELVLTHLHIDKKYRSQGLGTRLMKYAVKIHERFKLPARWTGDSNGRPGNYLDPDGIRFIDACFDKRILNKKIFFDERDYNEFDEQDYHCQ